MNAMPMTGRKPTNEEIISQVTARLQVRLPAASAAEIRRVVSDLLHSYDESRVRDFIPVLVEREALGMLDPHHGRPARRGPSPIVRQDA